MGKKVTVRNSKRVAIEQRVPKVMFSKMCGVKERLLDFRSIARPISWLLACRSSWGEGQLGCWARHHLERW